LAFKIVVDSSSDIPAELAKTRDITVVPMPVTIGETTYLEGKDIFPGEFYAQFKTFPSLPKTSTPNPNHLLEAYESILKEQHEVIAIHLSSGLSSTVSVAQMVKGMCSQPEKVHIIDSLGASFGYGMLALLVSEKLANYQTWPELEQEILKLRSRMRYIFTLDTLEYLVQGGRVSKTAGFVGGLLDIKPILHLNTKGQIEPLTKVRSRRSAIRKLLEIITSEIVHPADQIVGISHSACLDEAQYLADEIKRELPVKDVLISDIGCVIGSHTGPGTLALFYLKK